MSTTNSMAEGSPAFAPGPHQSRELLPFLEIAECTLLADQPELGRKLLLRQVAVVGCRPARAYNRLGPGSCSPEAGKIT